MSDRAKSTLEELREMNVQRQRETQTVGTESNMTGHTTSHTEIQPEINISRRSSRQEAGQEVVLPASHIPDGAAEQETISLRARIKQASQAAQPTVVMKTVTIKMNPEMDKKIEDHCYATGRKKQDVIRDAVLLYFEAVEAEA